MLYTLIIIIISLIIFIAFLLNKLYKFKLLEKKSNKENFEDLKKNWDKFEELISSLIIIHNLGVLGSGKAKQNEFFQVALDSACDLVQGIRGSIMIFDEISQELKIVASRGISVEAIRSAKIKKGEGVAGRAFGTGEIIYVTDPSQNLQYKNYIGYIEQTEPFISIPLKVQEKVYGVLNIHIDKNSNGFSEYDLKFLNVLTGEIGITIENIRLYESVENFYLEMVQTLARIIDAKDSYTGDHATRAREKAISLAKELNMPEQSSRYIEYAALLHDIGKIGIDAKILLKPGKLNDEEYKEIQKHPIIGYQILSPIDFLAPVAQIVLYHHEWFNGSGYPDGLKGEEIPIGSRVVAIIDAWDAMVSDRPYRKAMPRELAIEEMKKGAGTQFDPNVVEAFLKLEEKEFLKSKKNTK